MYNLNRILGGGIEQRKKKREITHWHGQQCGDCRGEEEWVEVEEDISGINCDGKEKKMK